MKKYYGVTRSTDHLAHYGVKGMRWGVRKAIYTGNERMLDRHYRKAAKKLNKLQDIGLHPAKYAAKSAAYGAAAIGTGTLAVGGTNMAGDIAQSALFRLAKLKSKHSPRTQEAYNRYVNDRLKSKEVGDKIRGWGKKAYKNKEVTSYIENAGGEKAVYLDAAGKPHYQTRTTYTPTITGETIYRAGTGLVTAGLAAKAAQNAYRSRNAEKYLDKADKWRKEMDDIFAGTKYEGHYETVKRRKRR